jgi:hypothetical protein
LWPSTDEDSRAVREIGEVGRSGAFAVDLEVREGREGQYAVQLFLFWPDAGSQSPRCHLSPLNVISATSR